MPALPSGGAPFRKDLSFRTPLVDPAAPVKETSAVAFGDLVRMVAEGIADAQASLDRASASLLTELANTKVEVVPRIEETIGADGAVSYQHAPVQQVSLLDLGVTPTFYQFSEATIEVAMDLQLVENSSESGDLKKKLSVYAETSSIRFERKLNRDVKTSSKLTAKLVPVPRPLRLDPVRTTKTPS